MEALNIDRFVDKLREFEADALLTGRVRIGASKRSYTLEG